MDATHAKKTAGAFRKGQTVRISGTHARVVGSRIQGDDRDHSLTDLLLATTFVVTGIVAGPHGSEYELLGEGNGFEVNAPEAELTAIYEDDGEDDLEDAA